MADHVQDPQPVDLQAFMGLPDDYDSASLNVILSTAMGMVDGYCRGRARRRTGELKPGVREVVLTVAARLVANPGQVAWREQAGAYNASRGVGFNGFTLTELYVLDRYRKRAI